MKVFPHSMYDLQNSLIHVVRERIPNGITNLPNITRGESCMGTIEVVGEVSPGDREADVIERSNAVRMQSNMSSEGRVVNFE